MTIAQLIKEKIDDWREGKLDTEELLQDAFEEVADLAYSKAKRAH